MLKRILSALMAVVVLLAAGRIGYYFYAEKGTYISLEDSGLEIRDGKLYATKPHLGRLYAYRSADQSSMFLIMVDTMKARHDYPEQNIDTVLFDFSNQIAAEDMDPEKIYEDRLSGIEKVYYLSEEYTNFHFDFTNEEQWDAQSKEVEEKGTLLWSAER